MIDVIPGDPRQRHRGSAGWPRRWLRGRSLRLCRALYCLPYSTGSIESAADILSHLAQALVGIIVAMTWSENYGDEKIEILASFSKAWGAILAGQYVVPSLYIASSLPVHIDRQEDTIPWRRAGCIRGGDVHIRVPLDARSGPTSS